MAYQLIEIVLPEGRTGDIGELLHDIEILASWHDQLAENRARIHLLVETGRVEQVLDRLETYLQPLPGARAVLLPVEAVIPRPAPIEHAGEPEEKEEKDRARISRQELLADVAAGTTLSANYLAMVMLSAIIAAIGLLRNDTAIIIGAMVLAPLLLPNMAFGLANTLGDTRMGLDSVRTTLAGLVLAVLTGIGLGLAVSADPTTPAIMARTRIGWSDLVLALASGGAGVLALTGGGSLSLVGVMVAVALMPPLVSGGLLIGSGHYASGGLALSLAIANIICVNLAAVITFHLQGISPSTWWEKNKARRARRRATTILLGLLAVLAALLLLGR
jgi:uncharacterized hydrophobic protein (TIGR00341 family)